MKAPLVSVIMPAYNSAKYVCDAIESVLNQTYENFEFIIVDDCSTDETFSCIEQYTNDHRVNAVRLSSNHGVAYARNSAIKIAEGKFVAFIDADDIWMPEKLDRQISYMKAKNADFTYSNYEMIDEFGHAVRRVNLTQYQATYQNLLKTNFIPTLTVIVNKTLLVDKAFKQIKHEDYALWLAIFRDNDLQVCLVPEVLAEYRLHRASLSSNKVKSARWVWNIYRAEEKLSFMLSIRYFISYMIHGVTKHTGGMKAQ
ncbi:glycosyltransferase family 2 protein [Lactiplantibacillus pentosus]|uniref:glycosyltransferase family 2 protein n=1 Tax=Lactiplantibacillus pentosus TaxID=1589 RepID=UPI001C1FDCB4|nr:glycosyltransferase [Lactiplantibacillus pentosus]MBU7504726.1 glycosyltransferase [Lactiplantibacillus pentosus]MDY1544595.1 glycosyltransferase [Lactiplantibacillus pentosus]